jgi:hypothetical protein
MNVIGFYQRELLTAMMEIRSQQIVPKCKNN